MNTKHMLTYHLLIPVVLAVGLLVFGAPLGVALVVGMMAGCFGMALMMIGGMGNRDARDGSDTERERLR